MSAPRESFLKDFTRLMACHPVAFHAYLQGSPTDHLQREDEQDSHSGPILSLLRRLRDQGTISKR
jgi:hypothetical protein